MAFELDDLQISRRRQISQLSRKQIIAGVSIGNFHDLTGTAKILDGFSQNDFHFSSTFLVYSLVNGSNAMFRAFLIASFNCR